MANLAIARMVFVPTCHRFQIISIGGMARSTEGRPRGKEGHARDCRAREAQPFAEQLDERLLVLCGDGDGREYQ